MSEYLNGQLCPWVCNFPPNLPHAVLLPVNDVIQRDRLSIRIKINLLLKLVCEIDCLQMIQQLNERMKKKTLS